MRSRCGSLPERLGGQPPGQEIFHTVEETGGLIEKLRLAMTIQRHAAAKMRTGGCLNHSGFDEGSVSRNMRSWREETATDVKTNEVPARALPEGGAADAGLGCTNLDRRPRAPPFPRQAFRDPRTVEAVAADHRGALHGGASGTPARHWRCPLGRRDVRRSPISRRRPYLISRIAASAPVALTSYDLLASPAFAPGEGGATSLSCSTSAPGRLLAGRRRGTRINPWSTTSLTRTSHPQGAR